LNDSITSPSALAGTLGQPIDAQSQRPPLWQYGYTFALAGLMLFMSYSGADKQGEFAKRFGHVVFYGVTIATELVLLGLTYLGMRFARMKLREVVGGRWNTFEDFLLDFAIAFGFFIVSFAVLIGLGQILLRGSVDEAKKLIQSLAPNGALELLLWTCMSATAGFVEEIVFRGYFQRQFSTLARNAWIGMLLSAVIFGLSHGYEGKKRMFLIFIYGAMFGTLAILRKNLRPGMMAHAAHDTVQGVIMMIARKLINSGVIK
jgi:membrane protease YdiL (CAAX protease family)